MTFRCPVSLLNQLDAAKIEFKKRDRTEAIVDLLRMSFFILEKKPVMEKPEVVEYLRNNLYNTALVDWVAELPKDRLEILYKVFADERVSRISGSRVGN